MAKKIQNIKVKFHVLFNQLKKSSMLGRIQSLPASYIRYLVP